jgi:hypothetical protein
MNRAEEILLDLLALCPAFLHTWENEREFGRDEYGVHTVCGVFAILSHYVADRLHAGDTRHLEKLFQYIVDQMLDDSIYYDIAYCFLENIMNRIPDIIDPKTFVPLLGPLSKQYCRQLDAAWGTDYLGLRE